MATDHQKDDSTLGNSLAARLRTDIMCGAIPPGERLHLGELKARFGTSFSPLREALTRLAAEGMVVAEGQKGFHVAPISSENLTELVRLRTMLEEDALRESIRRGDDAWEERLVAAHFRLNKLNPDRAKPESEPAWEEAHRAYHMALVSACGMPLLLKFCGMLHDLSDRYRRLFLQTSPHDSRAHTEHQSILDAALARDAEKACSILHAHIERTGRNVQKALDQRLKSPIGVR